MVNKKIEGTTIDDIIDNVTYVTDDYYQKYMPKIQKIYLRTRNILFPLLWVAAKPIIGDVLGIREYLQNIAHTTYNNDGVPVFHFVSTLDTIQYFVGILYPVASTLGELARSYLEAIQIPDKFINSKDKFREERLDPGKHWTKSGHLPLELFVAGYCLKNYMKKKLMEVLIFIFHFVFLNFAM